MCGISISHLTQPKNKGKNTKNYKNGNVILILCISHMNLVKYCTKRHTERKNIHVYKTHLTS